MSFHLVRTQLCVIELPCKIGALFSLMCGVEINIIWFNIYSSP